MQRGMVAAWDAQAEVHDLQNGYRDSSLWQRVNRILHQGVELVVEDAEHNQGMHVGIGRCQAVVEAVNRMADCVRLAAFCRSSRHPVCAGPQMTRDGPEWLYLLVYWSSSRVE